MPWPEAGRTVHSLSHGRTTEIDLLLLLEQPTCEASGYNFRCRCCSMLSL
jgi:hypothetical protein